MFEKTEIEGVTRLVSVQTDKKQDNEQKDKENNAPLWVFSIQKGSKR